MIQEAGSKHESYQAIIKFDNGYSASVVSHGWSYGGKDALFELLVEHNGEMCYSITNVVGHATFREIADLLDRLEALPHKDDCTHTWMEAVYEVFKGVSK
jgi:hypothetical protein